MLISDSSRLIYASPSLNSKVIRRLPLTKIDQIPPRSPLTGCN
ncbi:MAG: hypothetical protein ACJAS1_003982 [Oleiphilaceae bacterium]|jgi:hypothetical protein